MHIVGRNINNQKENTHMQKLDVPNKRITITLTPDTEERLRKYAVDNHMSVSQAVT